MLMLISPAKSLDYDRAVPRLETAQPQFMAQAAELVELLKSYTPAQLSALMDISDELAHLNADRFASWSMEPTEQVARPSLFAFAGDVYDGLDAHSLKTRHWKYLQEHLRILSGLYGLLKPQDMLQAYRLEMGTRLETPRGRNLYEFWGDRLLETLKATIETKGWNCVVNLASEEYARAARLKGMPCRVVTPVFEDWKSGKYKVISFFAKRARGAMVRFAAMNAVRKPEQLKSFDLDGYAYCEEASGPDQWVYRRRVGA